MDQLARCWLDIAINHVSFCTHIERPYMYGTILCPIRVWDSPYAYGPTYAYGAEHIHTCYMHSHGPRVFYYQIIEFCRFCMQYCSFITSFLHACICMVSRHEFVWTTFHVVWNMSCFVCATHVT